MCEIERSTVFTKRKAPIEIIKLKLTSEFGERELDLGAFVAKTE